MTLHTSFDRRRETKRERRTFAHAYQAERFYTARLRRVADLIGELVKAFHPFDTESRVRLDEALRAYKKTLTPWAHAVAKVMLTDVSRRNTRAWRDLSEQMGFELKRETETSAWGTMMRAELERQVDLITSLPTDAAQRVQAISVGQIYSGDRAAELAKQIMRTGEVTRARADLIARTEVGRASSTMLKARAVEFGSDGYIWRTAHDRDVRPLHKTLEGTFHAWDDPPVSGENGERSLPGGIYNCRCYAEPVIPEEFR